MPRTPDDVGDVRAVPQTTKQHGQEQVAIGHQRAFAVTAEGDVQVVTQPGRQADVPAPPELGDRLADVRLLEVFHEAETHHQAQADGHVAVTGEVEIQLRGIRQGAEPGIARARVLQGKAVVGHHRQGVGDEDFLDETLHEPRAALGELVEGVGAVVELVGQVAETQHGAGDQVREDRHERREVDQVAGGRGVAAVHVDDVADRLEDVERDTDRQQHVGEDERLKTDRRHHRVDAVDAEVGVLEVAEDAQVHRDAKQQPALRRFGPHTGGTDFEADPVVPQRDGREQREEVHTPPGVEHVAGDQQQQVAIALPAQVVQAEKDRQEQKQEHVG
ncbi:hypothetical protein D3C76_848460 [compost metagenome]